MVSEEEWEKILQKGSEAMIQALINFGPSETLNLLVAFSNHDPVVNHLLMKYPSVVAVGEFFSRLLLYENRNNELKQKIKVKRNCNSKGKVINKRSTGPENTFKIFDESPGPLFKNILSSEA